MVRVESESAQATRVGRARCAKKQLESSTRVSTERYVAYLRRPAFCDRFTWIPWSPASIHHV